MLGSQKEWLAVGKITMMCIFFLPPAATFAASEPLSATRHSCSCLLLISDAHRDHVHQQDSCKQVHLCGQVTEYKRLERVLYRTKHVKLLVTQSHPILGDPRGVWPTRLLCVILQVRILEWVAISSSRDLPNPGIKPVSLASPALAGDFFTTVPPKKVVNSPHFTDEETEA